MAVSMVASHIKYARGNLILTRSSTRIYIFRTPPPGKKQKEILILVNPPVNRGFKASNKTKSCQLQGNNYPHWFTSSPGGAYGRACRESIEFVSKVNRTSGRQGNLKKFGCSGKPADLGLGFRVLGDFC